MRFLLGGLALLVALLAAAAPAAADDDPRFRRTTPRADLVRDGGILRLGVPAGRAWGVESALLPVPRRGAAVRIEVAVADPDVREAFVRVAWYAVATGRSRQLAVDDSPPVAVGPSRMLGVALDPPEGAIAYRVRVLVRLWAGSARSLPGAIRFGAPELVRVAVPLTRLLPTPP